MKNRGGAEIADQRNDNQWVCDNVYTGGSPEQVLRPAWQRGRITVSAGSRSCVLNCLNEMSMIAKVYKIVGLKDQPTDFTYWQSQPYEARLAALEEIRREYHGWNDEAEPRLQRVYTIVKRNCSPVIPAKAGMTGEQLPLNIYSVRYLVVGGYAVALHGYPRYTEPIWRTYADGRLFWSVQGKFSCTPSLNKSPRAIPGRRCCAQRVPRRGNSPCRPGESGHSPVRRPSGGWHRPLLRP